MIGGAITVKVKAVGAEGSFRFSGVITQIDSSRHSGHAGDIIISGFSPTYLMDNGPHRHSWEEKAIKDIAQDVVQHFPQNLLQPGISPSYGETISYMVQYKETAWRFLSRICNTYGEWLMYDGQKLLIGPPQGSKVKLIYGNTLNSFDMAMAVRPTDFNVMAYDYVNTQVYDGQPSGIPGKAGLSELGKHVFQKSTQFYGTQPKLWNNDFLTNKKQLDDFVNARAIMQSSHMVKFHGNSGHPAIQLGATVSVQGKNVFNQKDESFGDYTVVSVSHHCDGQGNYSNTFVSIPASLKMPPGAGMSEPHSETQSALVTDNNDSDGLGRVRVRFHWMKTDEKSPWLRVASPHGGDNKGIFFMPEVGEEVIVGFEGGSPAKPFVIGMLWNSNAKTTFSNSGNDVKAIQTRSGNLMVMDDNEGSVHIADAKGNDIKIDGSGNINITGSESIVLTCGNAKIEMKKDGTVKITGKEITIDATDKATMKSGQASFAADGQQNNADMKGMNANVEGTQGAKVKGMTAEVSGDTQVDIKANAQVQIQSSGMVTVKGSMIMLN